MRQRYEDRLRRVIRYMHDNPGGDLSLDRLADIAAMSRFHWQKVFLAMTGETCAQAARRIRLYRAGHLLVHTKDPVARIAARVGYGNAQSFVRAFRGAYGLTPVAFRKAGTTGDPPVSIRKGHLTMFTVTLRDQPPTTLAAMPHKGAYPKIGRAFEQLAAVISSHDLWPRAGRMVGVFYDDPSAVAEEDLNSVAGLELPPDVAQPPDLTRVTLPGGEHAVLILEGPYSGLPAAYDYLYGDWLAKSGREPADSPSFEIYLTDPRDTAPGDLRTEICLPLAP